MNHYPVGNLIGFDSTSPSVDGDISTHRAVRLFCQRVSDLETQRGGVITYISIIQLVDLCKSCNFNWPRFPGRVRVTCQQHGDNCHASFGNTLKTKEGGRGGRTIIPADETKEKNPENWSGIKSRN